MEAAIKAETIREQCLSEGKDFTFETVLSTDRNLLLLKKAKEQGYFIKCFYILTSNPYINVQRVKVRHKTGGHDVPTDKIISRYYKSLDLLPKLVDVSDIIHVYDNTENPIRIFKKKKGEISLFENDIWSMDDIKKLVF